MKTRILAYFMQCDAFGVAERTFLEISILRKMTLEAWRVK